MELGIAHPPQPYCIVSCVPLWLNCLLPHCARGLQEEWAWWVAYFCRD